MDQVLADSNSDFASHIKNILIQTMSYYKSAVCESDKEDYADIIHNMFKLLTVLSYDVRTCELLCSSDIKYASSLVKEKSKKKRLGVETTKEEEKEEHRLKTRPGECVLLIDTILRVVKELKTDPIVVLHFSSVVRNLSCNRM